MAQVLPVPSDFGEDDDSVGEGPGALPARRRLRKKCADPCRALRGRGRTVLRAARMGLTPGAFKSMRKFGLPVVFFNLLFYLEQNFGPTDEDPCVRSNPSSRRGWRQPSARRNARAAARLPSALRLSAARQRRIIADAWLLQM